MQMTWQNIGSAPCYKPYRLAYRLRGEPGFSKVCVSEITVNRWLPGSMELFTDAFLKQPGDLPAGDRVTIGDAVALPADLPAGVVELSLAVVDATSSAPVVRLGIKGRAIDGWYPLGKVRVVK